MKKILLSIILVSIVSVSFAKVFIYGGFPIDDSQNPLKEYSNSILKGTASLAWQKEDGLRHFCTAIFLSPKHLLTAAHCFHGIRFSELNQIYIAYGIKQFTDGITLFKLKINHDFFNNDNSIPDDIALIELEEDLPFNIDPFNISSKEVSLSNLIFAGYGKNKTDDTPYNRTLYSAIGTIKKEDDKNKVLITNYTDFGTGMCYGDSGGPLLRISNDNQIELVGVTHGTSGYEHEPVDDCSDPLIDGIFTDIRYYNDWLECSTGLDLDHNKIVSSLTGCDKIEPLKSYIPKLSIHRKENCEQFSSDWYNLKYDPNEGVCIPASERSCEDYGGKWNEQSQSCVGWE